MRILRTLACAALLMIQSATSNSLPQQTQTKRIVIAVSTMLDGKGRVLHDTRIVIEGSKIVAVDPKAEPVDYDLRGLTVMPGWIDAHVHLTWIFGKDGKNAGQVLGNASVAMPSQPLRNVSVPSLSVDSSHTVS